MVNEYNNVFQFTNHPLNTIDDGFRCIFEYKSWLMNVIKFEHLKIEFGFSPLKILSHV